MMDKTLANIQLLRLSAQLGSSRQFFLRVWQITSESIAAELTPWLRKMATRTQIVVQNSG